MELIKSLIYRELFIGRRSYIAAIAGFIGILVMCVLVRASLRWGNLAAAEDTEAINEISFYMCGYFLTLVFFTPFNLAVYNIHQSDIQSRYILMSCTLPASPIKQTAAKFIIKVVLFLCGLGLSLLNVLLITAIIPVPQEALMICDTELNIYAPIFVIAASVLLYDCLHTPLVLCGRTVQKVNLYKNISGFPVPVLLMVLLRPAIVKINEYSQVYGEESANELINSIAAKAIGYVNGFSAYFIPVVIILFAINFTASYYAVKRRES